MFLSINGQEKKIFVWFPCELYAANMAWQKCMQLLFQNMSRYSVWICNLHSKKKKKMWYWLRKLCFTYQLTACKYTYLCCIVFTMVDWVFGHISQTNVYYRGRHANKKNMFFLHWCIVFETKSKLRIFANCFSFHSTALCVILLNNVCAYVNKGTPSDEL